MSEETGSPGVNLADTIRTCKLHTEPTNANKMPTTDSCRYSFGFLNALAHILQPVIISRNTSCTQDNQLQHFDFKTKTTVKLSQVDACITGILLLKLINK